MHYAEKNDTLHVFESISDVRNFILENPTAYAKDSRSAKPRRWRDGRNMTGVLHREDGTVARVRNGHTTRIIEKGSDFGANVPTM